jgi:hypothetical protein
MLLEGFEMESSWNITRDMDWRSLVIGLLIGIVVLMASGHETGQRFLGRYVPVTAGNSADAIFVVDTYSGHIWRIDETSTIDYGTPEMREEVPRTERID